MGPYCKFCDTRCFCYFPQGTPDHILKAYGTSTIIATCPAGQAFEKRKVGYCYNDIVAIIRAAELPDAPAESVAGQVDPQEIERTTEIVTGETATTDTAANPTAGNLRTFGVTL